eukprot:augustus_masked-scaffold_8-processed-gene-13.11-mRNA-1 protein AED:1.00 eAED:1.00 QI:0/0/0/0/1/1/3/0/328
MSRYLGLADTSLASTEVALHREFPGVHFDKSLVQPEVKRFKTEGRDSEDTNVQILMKTGQKCSSKEGRFELYFANEENGRPTLKGLSFQAKLQKELVDLYFDSVQIDTTHGLSKCIFVSMFPVGVDTFMKTVHFVCNLMQTENNMQVTRNLTDFEVKKMKMIMSNVALALAKSAQNLGVVHVCCVKHLFSSFSSGTKEFHGVYFKTFINSLKKLVREDLVSQGQFDEGINGRDLLVPKKPGVRYSMLQSACKTLCEETQHSTDEGWRKVSSIVIRKTNALRQNTDESFFDVDTSLSQHSGSTILSPKKRKQRRKGTVVRSQSRLNFNS